jgi:hypothetical protein
VLVASVAAGWGLQRAFSQNEGTSAPGGQASGGQDGIPATGTAAANVVGEPQWDKTMSSADSNYDVVPRSQKELAMRAKLNEPATVQFIDTPLDEVIDQLSNKYEFHIELDRNALTDIGVDTSSLVNANYRGMPLETALRLMLSQHKLTYIVGDEYLLITSHDVAQTRLDTRVYPIRQEWSVDGTELATAIMSVIEPLSWDENGGAGSVRPLGRYLLVYQTQEVHDEVKDLLRQIDTAARLERAQQGRPTGVFSRGSDGIR